MGEKDLPVIMAFMGIPIRDMLKPESDPIWEQCYTRDHFLKMLELQLKEFNEDRKKRYEYEVNELRSIGYKVDMEWKPSSRPGFKRAT